MNEPLTPLTFESFSAYLRDAASKQHGVILSWQEVATLTRALVLRDEPATSELDVERLARALALAEVNCWANTTAGHKMTDLDDGTEAHRRDAAAIAREYAALEGAKG